jgi:hypothetical protein
MGFAENGKTQKNGFAKTNHGVFFLAAVSQAGGEGEGGEVLVIGKGNPNGCPMDGCKANEPQVSRFRLRLPMFLKAGFV